MRTAFTFEKLFGGGLPSAGGLLMLTWKFYLEHFRGLMGVSLRALLALPFLFPGMALTVAGISPSGSLTYASPSWKEPGALAWVVLGMIAALLVTAAVRATLIGRIQDQLRAHGGARIALRPWRWKTFAQYLAALLLVGALVSVGFRLWFIPGVIAAAYLLFVEPSVVLEGDHIVAAFKRSISLVRGRFWPVLWRAVVVNGALVLATAMLALLTVQMPLAFLKPIAPDYSSQLRWLIAPFTLIAWLITAFSLPLFLSFQVILFNEVKKLRT